jgi:hypothetical protein
MAVEPTAYSVRSAPAFGGGSLPAFDGVVNYDPTERLCVFPIP